MISNTGAYVSVCIRASRYWILVATGLILFAASGCRQPEVEGKQDLPSTGLTVEEGASLARRLVFVSGGRLRMLAGGGDLSTLSERGNEQVPVGVFDVSGSTGEAALTYGGSVGVVPFTEPADGSEEGVGEEWYDLRSLAGDDFYVSLVGFVPGSRRMLAGGYRASALDEGFTLLSVDRDTEEAITIDIPEEQRRLLLRELKFSPGGSAYLHLVDETVPTDYVYRIVDGELALVFDTEELLGRGTGEGFEVSASDLGGLVMLRLVDYMASGEDLYLALYMLSEGREEAGDNLAESYEIWRYNRETGAVVRRYDLANPQPDKLIDMYFAMDPQGIYFARLSLIDELAQGQSPGFSLMRLDAESGETEELFSRELPLGFHSLAIFPGADACAVLYGTEDKLRMDGISLAGEKFQTGISVGRSDVRYLLAD